MGPQTILIATIALLWSAGWVIAARLAAGRALLRKVVLATSDMKLSIIIPARNEEHNLPTLLRSIQAQSMQPHEIIVVDDGSSDRTAELARQFGAAVISSAPLPEGWRGKTWACHQGARAVQGQHLMFLDADTWFEPGGLGNILAAYNGGAWSVGPYHTVHKPYEHLSAFFNVVMNAATVPRGLFGQMLLVDRESYQRAGGHEAVKGYILENFRLAKHFAAAGVATCSVTGRGVLAFRMYPDGVGALVRGWIKGFASGAGATPAPILLLIVAWLTGMAMVIGALSTHGWAAIGYGLFAIQAGVLLRQVGSFRWYAALLYPIPLLFFFVIFAVSAMRSGRPVTWKGRAIRAD